MHKTRALITAFSGCLSLVFATVAAAELHVRLDGAAAYDDLLDITWLTDAGLSGSNSWENQLTWIDDLNNANHLGFNDWRLASMSVGAGVPTGSTTSVFDCEIVWEPLCRDNELSHLFFYTLGGSPGNAMTGDQTVGDVTLTNIQPVYWSGTEYATGSAWITHFTTGFGVWSFKSGNRHGWAVRSGDVNAPEPEDSDTDGIPDTSDNCQLVENPEQRDSNGDGIGNLCDPDLNDDNIVNAADLGLLKSVFLSNDADADFNGDGVVNAGDLGIMKAYFLLPPGPSGQ